MVLHHPTWALSQKSQGFWVTPSLPLMQFPEPGHFQQKLQEETHGGGGGRGKQSGNQEEGTCVAGGQDATARV